MKNLARRIIRYTIYATLFFAFGVFPIYGAIQLVRFNEIDPPRKDFFLCQFTHPSYLFDRNDLFSERLVIAKQELGPMVYYSAVWFSEFHFIYLMEALIIFATIISLVLLFAFSKDT